MTERDKVIAEAKTWLNTPYHHNAKVKGAGVDCGQFIIGVYQNCGLLPELDLGAYACDWYLHRDEDKYLENVKIYFDEITRDDLKPGDLILFKYGRTCSHSGIYIGGGRFIHSYVDMGVIYSNLSDGEFQKRYHSSWRLKQWADS